MKIRTGNINDLENVRQLGMATWQQFENELTKENWEVLYNNLSSIDTYKELLLKAHSFVCENEKNEIIGMSYLVPSGNPTEIFNAQQCYIRFVTVSQQYKGLQLGQELTKLCIEQARKNRESIIALHTSEFMNSARHIYEKLGFKIVKEIEPRLGKKYWLYEMEL